MVYWATAKATVEAQDKPWVKNVNCPMKMISAEPYKIILCPSKNTANS
jgi:hypothetical protein